MRHFLFGRIVCYKNKCFLHLNSWTFYIRVKIVMVVNKSK